MIRVFRTFDWLSSVSSSEIMAKINLGKDRARCPMTSAKNAKTKSGSFCNVTHKNPKSKTFKNFCHANLKTCGLFWRIGQVSCSIAWRVAELQIGAKKASTRSQRGFPKPRQGYCLLQVFGPSIGRTAPCWRAWLIRSPSLVCHFFTSCEGDGVWWDGAQVRGRPDLPVSLLMVLHTLRLECEKLMKLKASSHCSCFFCAIQEWRDKAALSESVPAGTLRKERWRVSHSLSHHRTKFLRRQCGMHCLNANTRLSQNSCCFLDVCCIRRLQSLNEFTFQKAKTLSISFAKVPTLQRIGVDRHLLWVSVALWGRVGIVTAGTYLEHVCQAVGTRSGLVPTLHRWEKLAATFAAARGCWLLTRSPDSHCQGMFCCNPSWHVSSWSHQHRDWGVGTSGWP